MKKHLLAGVLSLYSLNLTGAPECGGSDIFENRKEPIPFQQIPMVDPATGDEYHPNDMIEVKVGDETKTFRAADYFKELNKIERDLNRWGYSVKGDGDVTLSGWTQCEDKWKAQAEKITKTIRKELTKYLLEDQDWDALWDKVKDEYDKNIPDYDEMYRAAESGEYEANLPPVPVFTATKPTLERAVVDFDKKKTWSWNGGDKSKLYAKIDTIAQFGATKAEAHAIADLNIESAIAGEWEGNLLNVKVEGKSPGTGPLELKLRGFSS